MNPVKQYFYEVKAKKMVEALKKRGFNAIYSESFDDAKEKVISMIPEGASVALGGSVTLQEMGLLDEVKKDKYKYIDRYAPVPWEETLDLYRQGLLADVLLTSTNAITEKGELVNVDCSGNRLAGMIFGPKKVIVVAGVNKIVKDIDAALKRLKEVAPMNCRRINHDTPCRETGECVDCLTPARMCNNIGIICADVKFGGRTTVIIVPDVAGF